MINYIVENQSLIKSHLYEEGEYDTKKSYINENEMWKFFCTPSGFHDQLRRYYTGLNLEENELYLTIRTDFVKYTFEEIPFNREILKEVNSYLDSILRKGESVDTSKCYWSLVFSDSFYDYKGVTIFKQNHRTDIYFVKQLEIVFLFDKQNRITMVNICFLVP
jgi:hypothetical protein